MISGTNPSAAPSLDVQYNPFTQKPVEGNDPDAVIQSLIQRKKNVMEGGVNCIPLPFKRFRNEVPGVEQGQYAIITASTKTGKTQCASFIYLYSVLDYAFSHRDACSVHIIYFSLEESPQRVLERYMSHLLYQFDGIRLAPSDLRSTSSEYPVPDEALELLQSQKYKERLDFF